MQVVLEQPSRSGLDILMPDSISTFQGGSHEAPAASSMPQPLYHHEASKVPLRQLYLIAVMPKSTHAPCHLWHWMAKQVSEGPVLPVAAGRGEEQKDVLEERVRKAAAACTAAKQRRRSLFAQVAASTSASHSPHMHLATSTQEQHLWSCLSISIITLETVNRADACPSKESVKHEGSRSCGDVLRGIGGDDQCRGRGS